MVNFPGGTDLVGRMVDVAITEVRGHSLRGTLEAAVLMQAPVSREMAESRPTRG